MRLLAALGEVDAVTAEAIVGLLLLRQQKAGLQGLIELFHEFDEPICRKIVEHVDELFPASAAGVASPRTSRSDSTCWRSSAAACLSGGLPGGLGPARSGIQSPRSRRRNALHAGRPVAAIPRRSRNRIEQAWPRQRPHSLTADLEDHMEDRRQVIGAIEGGLACYGIHLQPKVIEAAMWFVDELGRSSGRWSGSPAAGPPTPPSASSPGVKSPRLVPFCITALHYSTFRAAGGQIARALRRHRLSSRNGYGNRGGWPSPRSPGQWPGSRNWSSSRTGRPNWCSFHRPCSDTCRAGSWPPACPSRARLDFAERPVPPGRPADCAGRRCWACCHTRKRRLVSLLRAISRDNDERAAAIARFELALRFPLEYPPF